MTTSRRCLRRGAHLATYQFKGNPNIPSWYVAEAVLNNRVIGSLRVAVVEDRMGVLGINVLPAFRRCEIGTRLYETAAAWGCENNKYLNSGVSRSPYAESFWRKQVEKGRAFCVAERPEGGCWEYKLNTPCPDSLHGSR